MLGHFRGVQVEHFSGAGEPQRRQQHQRALLQQPFDGAGAHPAHFTAVIEVHALTHAQRLGGDQIAGNHAQLYAVQWRAGQPQREPRFQPEPLVRRYLLHMGHHGAVGDPAAIHPSGLHTCGRQRFMHLGANAEHYHQAHAQGVQQGQVLNQLLSSARRHGFAFNQDDKGSPPVGIDVRGGITKPVDKGETCVQGPLSGSR